MADNVSASFTITTKFNRARLEQGLVEVWPDVNRLLGIQFVKYMTQNIWQWPNQPSPRDIRDTGHLISSYKPALLAPGLYEHSWTAEYAMAVHEGAVIKNAFGKGIQVILTARPWVRVTLREFSVPKLYAKVASAHLARIGSQP